MTARSAAKPDQVEKRLARKPKPSKKPHSAGSALPGGDGVNPKGWPISP